MSLRSSRAVIALLIGCGGVASSSSAPPVQSGTVTTVSSAEVGDDLTFGPDGRLYAGDYEGTQLRAATLNGEVEVLADGLRHIGAIAIDSTSGRIFLTAYDEGLVLEFHRGGRLDTLAAGIGGPAGLRVVPGGEALLIAANAAHAILRLPITGGPPLVVAQGAPLDWPTGIAVDDEGTIVVANMFDGRLVRINAGSEPVAFATLPARPGAINLGYIELFNDTVYVAHYGAHAVYGVSPTGTVNLVAGGAAPGHQDGVGAEARFEQPTGIAIDRARRALYVTDGPQGRGRLRRVLLGNP